MVNWFRCRQESKRKKRFSDEQRYPPRSAFEELRIVSKRYIGRWISALIVMLALFAIANSMLHNPRFEWAIIAEL